MVGFLSICSEQTRANVDNTGQTEWTINGRCTGRSEIQLTAKGVKQVRGTKDVLVGFGKLIDPFKFTHIFVSPRQRAQSTFDILLGEVHRDALVKEGSGMGLWRLRGVSPERHSCA